MPPMNGQQATRPKGDAALRPSPTKCTFESPPRPSCASQRPRPCETAPRAHRPGQCMSVRQQTSVVVLPISLTRAWSACVISVRPRSGRRTRQDGFNRALARKIAEINAPSPHDHQGGSDAQLGQPRFRARNEPVDHSDQTCIQDRGERAFRSVSRRQVMRAGDRLAGGFFDHQRFLLMRRLRVAMFMPKA